MKHFDMISRLSLGVAVRGNYFSFFNGLGNLFAKSLIIGGRKAKKGA